MAREGGPFTVTSCEKCWVVYKHIDSEWLNTLEVIGHVLSFSLAQASFCSSSRIVLLSLCSGTWTSSTSIIFCQNFQETLLWFMFLQGETFLKNKPGFRDNRFLDLRCHELRYWGNNCLTAGTSLIQSHELTAGNLCGSHWLSWRLYWHPVCHNWPSWGTLTYNYFPYT